MNPFYACDVSQNACDIQSQYAMMLNAIIYCQFKRIPVVLVHGYRPDPQAYFNVVPWSTVLDFAAFSAHVFATYGVMVVDRQDCTSEIVSAVWGTDTVGSDVLWRVHYVSDHHYFWDAKLSLVRWFDDPAPGHVKTLALQYVIGTSKRHVWIAHSENRDYHIYWSVSDIPITNYPPTTPNTAHVEIYADLLAHLSWHDAHTTLP